MLLGPGKKRKLPFAEGSASQLKYHRDSHDWKEIHARTQELLMNAAKSATYTTTTTASLIPIKRPCNNCAISTSRRPKVSLSNDPNAVPTVFSAPPPLVCTVCYYCERPSCGDCLTRCLTCYETFCPACFIFSYAAGDANGAGHCLGCR